MQKLFLVLGMVLSLVACGNKATPTPMPVPDVATASPVLPAEEASQLTNEDGTGGIFLGMRWEDMQYELRQKGISYDEDSSYLIRLEGAAYRMNQEGALDSSLHK